MLFCARGPSIHLNSMHNHNRIITALLLGLVVLNCSGQTTPSPADPAQIASARMEQEKALALAAVNAAKLDHAADTLIQELQAAVAANAPVKTYDAILLKLSAIGVTSNRDRYVANPKIEVIRAFTTHWQDYLYALAQGNFDQAGQTLRQMIQEAALLPIIPRSELMALQDKLAAQSAEADKTILAPLLKGLEDALAKANGPSDLDPLLVAISSAQTREVQLHPNRNSGGGALRTMQELRQFVNHWQEYLSLRDSGKSQEAQNALRNLTSEGGYGISEITAQYRSQILKKLNEPGAASKNTPPPTLAVMKPTYTAPVESLTKPGDLKLENLDAFASLLSVVERPGQNNEHPRLSQAVETLIKARNNIRSRDSVQAVRALTFTMTADLFTSGTGAYAVVLDGLRQQLLIQSFATLLESRLPDAPGENANEFLKRYINAQLAAKDWPNVYKAMGFARMLDPQQLEYRSAEPAFASLTAGLNQEVGEQYAMAVRSYVEALASTSPLVPMKDITVRLNKIKEEHPKEYADGMIPRKTRVE